MNAAADVTVGLVSDGDLSRASALEALPLDALWTGGHIASRNPSPEPLMRLARLSAVTERVRLGTAVLPLPLYPPAIVAKQVADLDRATGGRITLGVGAGGEYPQEFRACQVPLAERGRRLDEAIPLLRRLWTAETVDHAGPCYPMADVRVHPAPVRAGGPPIVVAGRREPAMRRAARLGDGWMPYLYSPQRYAASVATIRAYASDNGRDLAAFSWCVFLFLTIHPDGDRAREQAAQTVGGTYDQDLTSMIDRVAAVGTPSEVTATLFAFVDAGARDFIFMPAPVSGDADLLIRTLLGDVMPAVREHALAGHRDPAGVSTASTRPS